MGNEISDSNEINKLYFNLAESEIKKSPKTLAEKVKNLNFMSYAFEDYQIVLSHSITPDRIIKILPQGDEFGRILKRRKVEIVRLDIKNID